MNIKANITETEETKTVTKRLVRANFEFNKVSQYLNSDVSSLITSELEDKITSSIQGSKLEEFLENLGIPLNIRATLVAALKDCDCASQAHQFIFYGQNKLIKKIRPLLKYWLYDHPVYSRFEKPERVFAAHIFEQQHIERCGHPSNRYYDDCWVDPPVPFVY